MFYLLSEATSQGQLVSAVVVLGGAVAALWRHSLRKTEDTERRLKTALDKCEVGHRETADKREQDQEVMRELTGKVGKLEGLYQGHEQARKDLRGLNDHVLALLNKEVIDAAIDDAAVNGSNIVNPNVPNGLASSHGANSLVDPSS